MSSPPMTVLIVGASRGLGLGLAHVYARDGWRVIGTVRATGSTGLHALAGEPGVAVRIEMVDINVPDQVAALRQNLAGERLDVLFVNAGIANGPGETIPATSTEAFTTLMITNALSPLRVIEALADLVPADGVIAAMSSGLGSVTNNTRATWEIYRASKAALNTMLRSFAVRRGGTRAVLAVTPGWVRTDMGGPNAALDISTSVRGIAAVIAARRGQPGSAYVDYQATMCRGEHHAWTLAPLADTRRLTAARGQGDGGRYRCCIFNDARQFRGRTVQSGGAAHGCQFSRLCEQPDHRR